MLSKYCILILLNCILLSSAVASKQNTSRKIVEHTFMSEAFSSERVVMVQLPEEYNSKLAYPIVYVLAADDFYLGKVFDDIVHKTNQMRRYQQIPEIIIVGVMSKAWYQETIGEPNQLGQFLTEELPAYIQKRYATHQHALLVAHSYAGAYLVKHASTLQGRYAKLWSISPVFPNVDYIEQAVLELKSRDLKKTEISIFVEKENVFDVNLLQLLLGQEDSALGVNVDIVDDVSHHSILPHALETGLYELFRDYRLPSSEHLANAPLTIARLQSTLLARAKKYELAMPDKNILNNQVIAASVELANAYMDSKQFELAFEFWAKSNSRNRHYFINRWAERYQASGDLESAQTIWHKMSDIFPRSPFAPFQLMQISKRQQNIEKTQFYQQQLLNLYKHIEADEYPMFTAFANKLINEGEVDQGNALLTQLASSAPTGP